MGPPGLDLGMFLANFLWFYAGHSDASRRRGAVSGVMATIDSYKSAFRVQLGGTSGAGGAIREIQRQRQKQNGLREVWLHFKSFSFHSFHFTYTYIPVEFHDLLT